MSVFRKRGFAAHREESARREKAQEAKRGRLFDFFLKDGEVDIPVRFLTEEPITWYRHRIKEGNTYVNYACTADKNGEGCSHCDDGDRAGYVGSWLITDGREFETEERKNGQKTGKKITVKDRLKLFTRGSTDIAKLDNKSQKYGLMTRPWFVTKTGSGQSTSYELDRGEEDKLTWRQIDKLIEQLPEKYKSLYKSGDQESLYAILDAQIFGLENEDDGDSGESDDDSPTPPAKKAGLKKPSKRIEEEEPEDIDDGVQSLDDEEEDDSTPAKRKGIKMPAGAKKQSPKPAPSSKPSVGARKPAPLARKR